MVPVEFVVSVPLSALVPLLPSLEMRLTEHTEARLFKVRMRSGFHTTLCSPFVFVCCLVCLFFSFACCFVVNLFISACWLLQKKNIFTFFVWVFEPHDKHETIGNSALETKTFLSSAL